jgi:hypothetical protein
VHVWLKSPGLADNAHKLGAHVRFGTGFTQKQSPGFDDAAENSSFPRFSYKIEAFSNLPELTGTDRNRREQTGTYANFGHHMDTRPGQSGQ